MSSSQAASTQSRTAAPNQGPAPAVNAPAKPVTCETVQATNSRDTTDYLELASGVAEAAAALFAVFIAVRALRLQAAARGSERRSAIFHSLVVGPAIVRVPQFEVDAALQITRFASEIAERLASNAAVNDVNATVSNAVSAYRALYDPLFDWLVSVLNAWGSAELRQLTVRALERVEDVSEGFPLLQLGKVTGPQLVETLRERNAELMKVLVHYDSDAAPSSSTRGVKLPFGIKIIRA